MHYAMHKLYLYKTTAGPFYIAEHEERFHPLLSDESLGSYATPERAADDLAGGHTFASRTGVDTSSLGIPHDLSEWERLHPTCGPIGTLR